MTLPSLFRYIKGTLTGADCIIKDILQEADGGALLLDEVGNLAMETQQMLLRAIQEKRYHSVGDRQIAVSMSTSTS